MLIALRPGRNDKNFIEVTDRICQFYRASFVLMRVVSEDISEDDLNEIIQRSNDLLESAKSKCEVIIKKSNDSIEAIANASSSYDLLILGTPQKDNWISVLFGKGKDKFTEKSACSVLR